MRKGDFVGVVAEQEWDAVKAAAQLKVTWAPTPALPAGDLYERMRAEKTHDTVVASRGDVETGFPKAIHVAGATYRCPYQGHMPFAPNCAVADVKSDSALVMSSTQDVYSARRFLADVLGMKPEQVRVQYHEGSGTFGRSCYGDAEQSRRDFLAIGRPAGARSVHAVGRAWLGPVRPRPSRQRPCRHRCRRQPGRLRIPWLAARLDRDVDGLYISLQKPGVERASGSASITVNPMSTGSMYMVPNRKVVSHAVPMAGYLRGAALRSPLDLSFSFASEQTIDELAYAIKMDPLEFRRKNIGDKRWLGVLDAAAAAANRTPRTASSHSAADVLTGRGIGLGTHHVSYGAAVADIEMNRRTGNIVVKKIFAAMDVGLAVNPGLVENQIIGQAVQSVSRVLKEEVTFDKTGVTSLDWNSYPVLRFAEHPKSFRSSSSAWRSHRAEPAKRSWARPRPQSPTPSSTQPAHGCANIP